MSLIKPTQFARQAGISKQAVFKAITNGNLPFQLVNEKKMINTEDPGVINYLHDQSYQRETVQKLPSEKKAKIVAKSNGASEKQNEKPSDIKISSDEIDKNSLNNGDTSIFDIGKMKKYEDYKKVQLQNEKLRGRLLDRALTYDYVFLYLDKVHSNLERLAGAFMTDISHKIIEAGGVNSEIREEWKSSVLESIDTAKREIMKRLDEIAVKQNE